MSQLTAAINGSVWRWSGFFAAIIAAWAALYAMAADLSAASALFGPELWAALCAEDAGFAALFAMWALMAAAMMAPSVLPMLKTYEDLIYAGAGTAAGFWALVAGYLAVWIGFAALAALAQIGLSDAEIVDGFGRSTSLGFNAGLFALAGLYQFSALKEACLSRCRSPMMVFMADWRPGLAGAAHMGVRHGLYCLGCCVALMLLAFVGGTMNLIWMGVAMVLMTLEKLPRLGRPLTVPLGLVLIGAAAAATVTALVT